MNIDDVKKEIGGSLRPYSQTHLLATLLDDDLSAKKKRRASYSRGKRKKRDGEDSGDSSDRRVVSTITPAPPIDKEKRQLILILEELMELQFIEVPLPDISRILTVRSILKLRSGTSSDTVFCKKSSQKPSCLRN